MAVISLSVIESVEQVVSGIPRFITVSANMSAVIFYTLDNSIPTVNSNIYTGPIQLPTDKITVYLNIFASNGTDSSPIINEIYETIEVDQGARVPHSTTDAIPNTTQGLNDPYPFGTPPISPGQIFTGTAGAGYTTDNPLLPATSNAFDVNGNPTTFTNEPLIGIPTITQPIIYSDSDSEGNRGPGIGDLPPPATIQAPVAPPEQSNYSDKLFDPKALVIYQDFTKPNDPNIPVEINRQFYSQADLSSNKDSNKFFNSVDTPGPTGAFLRQHFNPTDNTLTYYYFNSRDNRWIISKTAYTPAANAGSYYNLVFGRDKGAGFVFQWVQFKANYLF